MARRPVPEMYPETQQFADNATIYNYGVGHGAIDYGVPYGTPLIAPEDMTLVFDGWVWDLPGGPFEYHLRWMQIKPARGDTRTGGGIMTVGRNAVGSHWIIAHAGKSLFHKGDFVRAGTVIQETGNTGSSTGPHSHVSLIPPNPNWNNGYFGAIDPKPYLTESYLPTQYVAWQGRPTSGTGAAVTEKEWFEMADLSPEVAAQIDRIVQKRLDAHWDWPRPRLGGEEGKTSYSNELLYLTARQNRTDAKIDAVMKAVNPDHLSNLIREAAPGLSDINIARLSTGISRALLAEIVRPTEGA